MGNSIWKRLLRRERKQPQDSPADEIERALRAARPMPPTLSQSRANSLFASALAETRTPRRSTPPHFAFVAAMSALGCTVAIGFVLRHHTRGRSPEPVLKIVKHYPLKHMVVKTAAAGNRRPESIQEAPRVQVHRPHRFLVKRVRHLRRQTHGLWFTRPLEARRAESRIPVTPAQLSANLPPDPFANKDNEDIPVDTAPSTTPGHLVVIVSGIQTPHLNVEVTTGEPEHAGFAKAAAYKPLGPGGGILTQCTIRENAAHEDITTAQYAVMKGQPTAFLVLEAPRPAAEQPEPNKNDAIEKEKEASHED